MTRPAGGLKLLPFLLLLTLPCYAQKKEPQQPEFKVPVDVIVVNATVTDKNGNPVPGLTVDDFKVYEDGKPQPIHTFALESYKATQSLEKDAPKLNAEVGRGEASEPTQPRLFSIVIDDLSTERELYYPITEAVKKFVDEDLLPGDQVAILSASGRVQYPFTTDRQLLRAEIGELFKKLNMSSVTRSVCPTLTELQAQRIATGRMDPDALELAKLEYIACMHIETVQVVPLDLEALVRNLAMSQYYETQDRNRVLLRTLRQYVRSLKHFEARKNVVLFSDGFLFEDLTFDLQDVVDQALRAGVILNTVDARGLYVDTFKASDNLMNLPMKLLITKDRLRSDDTRAQADSLNMLAHDTGGIFHENSNDLHAGLRKVSDRQAHFYVLTYAAPSSKADGRYHKIKLEVSRPGLQLSYRQGYYAPKEQLTFEKRKKEDILEALHAPGNVNEIPIHTGYVSYQVDDVKYEVELVTQIDIRPMKFAEEDSRRRNLISVVVVAFDEYDRYIDGLQKDVTFNLTPSGYSEILSRGFASKAVFRVPAGKYRIKTVVRESGDGKVGSLTKGIEVP
jgi:VWFA-related protein